MGHLENWSKIILILFLSFSAKGNFLDESEDESDWKMIFAARNGVMMASKNSTSQLLAAVSPLSNPVGRPVGVTCDTRRKIAYWTDAAAGTEKIYFATYGNATTQAEALVDTGLVLPEGVAYDWIGENLYFADSNLSHIALCGIKQKSCTILVKEEIGQIRELALDPNEGLMFWTDWGDTPKVVRAEMDGSQLLAVASTNIKWPNGIAIDFETKKVFWVDAGRDKIESIYYDGSDRKTLYQEKNFHPFGVDVFKDRLFWSDWNTMNISSVDKNTGSEKAEHYGSKFLINGIVICHPDRQPISRSNPCLTARCSHLCALSPSGFRCLCPVDMELENDSRTCKATKAAVKFVLAVKHTLKIITLGAIGKDVFESITHPKLKLITGLVYNPIKNSLIMSDGVHKKIFEYSLSRKTLTPIVKRHIDMVQGMDLDIVSGNLYWVDGGKQTIEMMSLKTGSRLTIMQNVTNPTDIVVAPEEKSLFISKMWRTDGKIFQMSLDGSRNKLIQRIRGGAPTVLAYYRDANKTGNILWCNKANHSIHSILLNHSTNYTTFIENLAHPATDAVMLSGQLYWLDGYSLSLNTLRGSTVYSTRFANESLAFSVVTDRTLFKMTVINPNQTSAIKALRKSHDCSWENPQKKKCSNICIITDKANKGRCECPEGFTLSGDKLTCKIETYSCSSDSFTCSNGFCINHSFVCDGLRECSEGEDELNCGSKNCSENEFSCKSNGACIPDHWVCDNEADCENASDERNCQNETCNEGFYQCKTSGACILSTWICDNEDDCQDGSDETEELCAESAFPIETTTQTAPPQETGSISKLNHSNSSPSSTTVYVLTAALITSIILLIILGILYYRNISKSKLHVHVKPYICSGHILSNDDNDDG